MPWQGNGTFIRVNPDFSGPTLWQQDKTAAIKIVASRHDVHDNDVTQGIERCLNLDGVNSMAADLDMAGFAINNVLAATAVGQAVNKAQLDVVNSAAASALITANSADDKADTNATNITALDVRVTALEAEPPGGVPEPLVVVTLKSNGAIRHKLNNQGAGAAAINVSTANRHFVNNDGALTMTFSGLPSADDGDLGADYQVEGQVVIWNGAGAPGVITIAGLTSPRTIGAQVQTVSVAQVLTYLISRIAGTNNSTLIWSNA